MMQGVTCLRQVLLETSMDISWMWMATSTQFYHVLLHLIPTVGPSHALIVNGNHTLACMDPFACKATFLQSWAVSLLE